MMTCERIGCVEYGVDVDLSGVLRLRICGQCSSEMSGVIVQEVSALERAAYHRQDETEIFRVRGLVDMNPTPMREAGLAVVAARSAVFDAARAFLSTPKPAVAR